MSERRSPGLLGRVGGWWDRLRSAVPGTANPGPSPRPSVSGQRGRILPEDPGPVRLDGVDHVEWYAGNAEHTALWLQRLGLPVVARQGPDTGVQDLVSYVIEAGTARLLLSTGLTANHDTTRSYVKHGDAIHDVAFRVRDVEAAYGRLIHGGLEPDHLPVEMRGDDDTAALSLVPVTTADRVLHTLVERPDGWSIGFAPGFVDEPGEGPGWATGVTAVTTVLAPGRLDEVVRQYQHLFDLVEVARGPAEEHAEVAVLADPSAVVAGDSPRVRAGALRLVFACPTTRTQRNHLDDFLFRHGGPGVRTVTLGTADLGATTSEWRAAGVSWLVDGSVAARPDGARRAVTTPLQARAPLVLALEEVIEDQDAVDVLGLARDEEAALAAHRRAHPEAEPLGTWAGGR